MALVSKVEAAIMLGVSIELLEYFVENCPKKGESVKLKIAQKTDVYGELFDENEVVKFRRYLNEPWPHSPKGKRPYIPEAIKNFIKFESHHGCAICGFMDNGEVAHIEPVSSSFNNAPDNLIYLCPNHHTKYDYGYKPSSNITLDVIRAAKTLKRNSLIRALRYEDNIQNLLSAFVNFIKKIESDLKKETDTNLIDAYLTESQNLMKAIPELLNRAQDQAKMDKNDNKIDKIIAKQAPSLTKMIGRLNSAKKQFDIRSVMVSVVNQSNDLLIELDEVECPHCNGRGKIGWNGDLCIYCKGACVVTHEKYENYDPGEIDEVECPHCSGKGTIGWNSDACPYCKGSCVVTHEKYENYDPSEIDEIECPHCSGKGTIGWNSDACPYCKGSCVVTHEKYENYDPSEIDEVECPHCSGKGTIGWNSDACPYCKGSCVVTREKYENYDPREIDEVECPHCSGKGTIGWNSDACPYCKGSCVVTHEKYENYDPSEIDEIECPHCSGRGVKGYSCEPCALCKGACLITKEKYEAYREKYGSRKW